jgi:DNA alkylation repair enzyme
LFVLSYRYQAQIAGTKNTRDQMENPLFIQSLKEVASAVKSAGNDATSLRKTFKRGYSFSLLPVNEQILIWDFIWNNSTGFAVRIQAFFFCEKIFRNEKELVSIWPVIKTWQDKVDNWALSDCLSKIIQEYLS